MPKRLVTGVVDPYTHAEAVGRLVPQTKLQRSRSCPSVELPRVQPVAEPR